MSHEYVLKILESDLEDPGAQKSGEYLETHVLAHSRRLVRNDRDSLVEVLRHWIGRRDEPRTMLAVKVAKELQLGELKSAIESLGVEVTRGQVFALYYLRWIEDALDSLN